MHYIKYRQKSQYGVSLNYRGNESSYQINIQGDNIGIVDINSTVVVEYAYDAWGNVKITIGSLASTLGKDNPMGYRSYYYDEETALYYMQNRYYNPEFGRFINADVLIDGRNITGTNLFAYCNNNPLNNSDPTGLYPRWRHLAIGSYKVGKGLVALATALKKGFVASALGSVAARAIGVAIGLALGMMPIGQWWGTVINVGIILALVLRAKSLLYDLPSGLWHLKQFIKHNHR